ncbi:MAG: right-handed parallel beta-helix repeat-containing protein [Planctomycetia bacterium]|nr:right-handed parallel beta-helix repeat-containing protein [Planctomycetia bacterium]
MKRYVWLLGMVLASSVGAGEIYVAPNGNDAAKGTLEAPMATLAGAQKRWRAETEPVDVILRGGEYGCTQTLEITEADAALRSVRAYRGEKPVLYGSQPVRGTWETWKGGIRRVELSADQREAFSSPGQLFMGGTRLLRARYPNFDSQNPVKGGFLYVFRSMYGEEGIGGDVGCIHNAGDSLTYAIDAPEAGTYAVWIYYGTHMASYNNATMDGRTVLVVNGGPEVPLTNLKDTGAWSPQAWAHCCDVTLKKGRNVVRWINKKGGGMNIGGWKFLRSNQKILVPADAFTASVGKQLTVHYDGVKNAFHAAAGELKPAWAGGDVVLKIFQSGSCRAFMEVVSIQSIDEKSGRVYLSGPECVAKLATGDRYFLENHLDFLDAPGEWYLDRKTGILYLYPLQNSVENVRFGVCGTLISVKRKTPLLLEGLTFTETAFTYNDGCVGYSMGSRGVVEIAGEGVTVRDCRFENIGRYAVVMSGGGRNVVRYCTIYNSGQGGVLLIQSNDNDVSDNVIENIGLEYKHIGGVVLERESSGNNVTHNFIQNSSRYGISLKNAGGNNEISFNDVRNTSLETYDTGAIEVTQGDRNFQSGSRIRNNRVLDTNGYSCIGPKEIAMSWGIYLDSFAGGYLVENNYVNRTTRGGFMFQGGKGNVLRNNVFLNASMSQGHFSNYVQNSEDLVFEHNVVAFSNPEAAWFSQGKNLPEVLTCDHNIYWRYGGGLETLPGFVQWKRLGFDAHSLVADPMFVDIREDDARLKPDSPCLKAGFQPIDLSNVGPRKRE